MKYIDADKLKVEIERLKETLPREVGRGAGTITSKGYGMLTAYNELLSFLDTLQEQEPQGLDVTDFCKPIEPRIAKCIADHWWDMMDDEDKQGLDEAAERYRRDSCNVAMMPNIDGPMPEYGGSVKDAFKAGAEWMAGQGLSFEFVAQYEFGVSDTSTSTKRCTLTFPLPANIIEGDKVIVQIRKK